jgi:hypothetical protein
MLPAGVHAQFKMAIEFDHPTTVRYEQIDAKLRIVNDSGKPLILDEKEGLNYIFFEVTKSSGDRVRALKHRPYYPRLIIPSGETGELTLNLLKYFDMTDEAQYIIKFYLRWGDTTLAAEPRAMEVVAGMEVAKEKRGIPGYDRRMREYSLRYWDRDKGQRLFLRVTDLHSGIIQGLFDLGDFVRIAQPEITFDQSGHVKIVHQTSSLVFTHSYFKSTEEGVTFLQREFYTTDGRKLERSNVVSSDPAKNLEGLQPQKRQR